MTQQTCARATDLAEMMREWGAQHPYSTLDIFLGRQEASDLAADPRPGVCFTLNTAFAAHLRAAGWDAAVHLAGVEDHDSPDRADVGSHLTVVTQVDGLPHLTDVGLGCGPLTPVPLVEGVHEFNGFGFPLTEHRRDGTPWWRLDIPPALSRAFTAMELCGTADAEAAAARAGHFLSPTTSPLRDVLLIQGWVNDRLVTVHRASVSVRTCAGTVSRDTLEDGDAWRAAVHGWFPATFEDADLAAAWTRLGTLDGR